MIQEQFKNKTHFTILSNFGFASTGTIFKILELQKDILVCVQESKNKGILPFFKNSIGYDMLTLENPTRRQILIKF